MARNSIPMARTAAGRRRRVLYFPYSLSIPITGYHPMTVGTGVYQFERTQPFTVGFWMNGLMPLTTTQHIFSEYLGSGTFRGITYRIDNSLFRLYYINTISTNQLLVSYTPPRPGTLTWVVVSYDGTSVAGGVSVWYDHISQTRTATSGTLTGTIVDATSATVWGGWAGGTLPFRGLLCEPFVDNRAWTQTEVDNYWYDRVFSLGTPVDRYALTEGSGNSVASSGSGAHTGTLDGSVTWGTVTPGKARTLIPQARLPVT